MLPQTPGKFAVFPIAAVAGSTCEELLYRGFFIGRLAPTVGTAAAVLSSSALFGLGHAYQGWIGVARTMLIGIAFGVAFALTHSLWWLLIAHTSANLSGVLLARRLLHESPESVCG
jgi:CAAX protease family protein